MIRRSILAVAAIIVMAVLYGPWMLLLLISIPIAILITKLQEKREEENDNTVRYKNIDEVTGLYGQPDDVAVLDSSKANEIEALILFYDRMNKMIVDGKEIKISDMTSVAPKNLAIAYMPDEYGVVINTTDPAFRTLQMKVNGEMGYAQQMAEQIASHIVVKR